MARNPILPTAKHNVHRKDLHSLLISHAHWQCAQTPAQSAKFTQAYSHWLSLAFTVMQKASSRPAPPPPLSQGTHSDGRATSWQCLHVPSRNIVSNSSVKLWHHLSTKWKKGELRSGARRFKEKGAVGCRGSPSLRACGGGRYACSGPQSFEVGAPGWRRI